MQQMLEQVQPEIENELRQVEKQIDGLRDIDFVIDEEE